MPHEELGFLASQVEARAVRRFLDFHGGGDAERGREPLQEIDDRSGGHSASDDSRAAASVLPPPARFIRRSAAGLIVLMFGGPIK